MKKYLIIILMAASVFHCLGTQAQNNPLPDIFNQDTTGITYGASKAISVITGEQLRRSHTLELSNSLYGLASGITVLQNGDYLSNASVSVRGRRSMTGNMPLILVDGIERDLNTLAADEIDKITILKDAASQAIYGFKGVNGVINITTKRGSCQKNEITVDYNYSLGVPIRLPSFVCASDYAAAYNEACSNDGMAPAFSQSELGAFAGGYAPDYYPDVDWMDATLKKHSNTHQVVMTARGGGKAARYFTAINYSNNKGLIRNAHEYKAYSTQLMDSDFSVRANLDVNVTKTTLARVNMYARFADMSRPGAVTPTDMMRQLYSIPSVAYPIKNSDGVWGGRTGFAKNPVAQTSYTGYATAHNRTLYADFFLEHKLDALTEGLSLYLKGAVDSKAVNWDSRTKSFLSESNVAHFDEGGTLIDKSTVRFDKDEKQLSFTSKLGEQKRGSNIQAGFNYARGFKDFSVNASLFYRQDKIVGLWKRTTSTHMDVVSYADFAIKNKYFAGVVMTGAGTSRLPKGSRWGLFPAACASWQIGREDFMKSSDVVDLFNIRTSFGLVGNDDVQPYLDKYPFGGSGKYYYTDAVKEYSGMSEIRLPSAYYTFAKTGKFNFGLDLRLFDFVSLSADAFYEHTFDMLVDDTGTSRMIGVELAKISNGRLINYGVDASLSFNRRIREFYFNVGGNFSFSRNKVLNMNETYKPYDYLKRTGHAYGQPFGLEVIGFFADQQDIDSSPMQYFGEVRPGDYKYRDQNGDGRIDTYDEVAIGSNSYLPEIYFSTFIELIYRNFEFFMLWQGTGNSTAMCDTPGIYYPMKDMTNVSRYYLDNCWHPRADNKSATLPRLNTKGNSNNYRANSVLLADNSYFKLRNVEISYALPQRWMRKMHFHCMKIFLRGTDLLSIDKLKIVNPEVMGPVYPAMSTFQAGFKFSF